MLLSELFETTEPKMSKEEAIFMESVNQLWAPRFSRIVRPALKGKQRGRI